MSNLFDDLRQRREAKEEETRRKEDADQRARQQAEQQAKERQELSLQIRREAKEKYNSLVTRVLQQLKDAMYPQESILGWNIGHSYGVTTPGGGVWTDWSKFVEVSLLFNEEDLPSGFECARDKQRIKCGLSESELVNALKQLHSPSEK